MLMAQFEHVVAITVTHCTHLTKNPHDLVMKFLWPLYKENNIGFKRSWFFFVLFVTTIFLG
jgi:hypothetical protein